MQNLLHKKSHIVTFTTRCFNRLFIPADLFPSIINYLS